MFDDEDDADVCEHGKSFSEICVQCCPEDDDGSFDGDEWSGKNARATKGADR